MCFATRFASAVVTAVFVLTLGLASLTVPAAAQDAARVDELFDRLQQPDPSDWRMTEREILLEWSKSGSAAMDLLLQRGRDALNDGRTDEAIDHLTALTDHAPNFAEGWNMRATAFFSIRRYGLSIADIQRTLALNPRHFGALSGLAMMLEELGYEADALAAYREALSLTPHRPDLRDAVTRLAILADGTDI